MTATFVFALSLTASLPQSATWTQAVEPFELADDLYYVGTADLASYLFASPQGHILIDVPLEENVDLIVANVRRLGFDPEDIGVLLASHAHFDHVGGLSRMREITGAQVLLSEADAIMIASGGEGPAGAGPRYPPVRADRTIKHLETVTVGDWTLTAQLTPGHTPGCTSWSGEATIQGEQFTFVSVCSLSVLANFRLGGADETYPGMGSDYCRSLTILDALEPDLFLATHGSFIGLERKAAALREGNPRAFVDRAGYESYLDRAWSSVDRALEAGGRVAGCPRGPRGRAPN